MLGNISGTNTNFAELTAANLLTLLGFTFAWVVFSANGTIAASHNVSSVSHLATGVWQVNFTISFTDANYAAFFNCQPTVSNAGSDTFVDLLNAGHCQLNHFEAGLPRDGSYMSFIAFR